MRETFEVRNSRRQRQLDVACALDSAEDGLRFVAALALLCYPCRMVHECEGASPRLKLAELSVTVLSKSVEASCDASGSQPA
jgi:hypothetical protein